LLKDYGRNVKLETFRNPRFTEFQTYFLKWKLVFVTHKLWFSMALGIPQNAEYLQKTLPKGTLILWNVLKLTYHLADDSKRFPSILSGSPLSPSKYSIVV